MPGSSQKTKRIKVSTGRRGKKAMFNNNLRLHNNCVFVRGGLVVSDHAFSCRQTTRHQSHFFASAALQKQTTEFTPRDAITPPNGRSNHLSSYSSCYLCYYNHHFITTLHHVGSISNFLHKLQRQRFWLG